MRLMSHFCFVKSTDKGNNTTLKACLLSFTLP